MSRKEKAGWEAYLQEPLSWAASGDLCSTPEQEAAARIALEEFVRRLDHALARKMIVEDPPPNHGYLWNLYTAKTGLEQGRRCLACHELQDVVHFAGTAPVMRVVRDLLEPYVRQEETSSEDFQKEAR